MSAEARRQGVTCSSWAGNSTSGHSDDLHPGMSEEDLSTIGLLMWDYPEVYQSGWVHTHGSIDIEEGLNLRPSGDLVAIDGTVERLGKKLSPLRVALQGPAQKGPSQGNGRKGPQRAEQGPEGCGLGPSPGEACPTQVGCQGGLRAVTSMSPPFQVSMLMAMVPSLPPYFILNGGGGDFSFHWPPNQQVAHQDPLRALGHPPAQGLPVPCRRFPEHGAGMTRGLESKERLDFTARRAALAVGCAQALALLALGPLRHSRVACMFPEADRI